jgi:hypothetical protein
MQPVMLPWAHMQVLLQASVTLMQGRYPKPVTTAAMAWRLVKQMQPHMQHTMHEKIVQARS